MIALLGHRPRSVDESKSATANQSAAAQQSRPRIGVLVLSPDFVKSFRLCYFRRKKMESQDIKYVGID
ncbi:hypothetical protein, partial [Leptospira santarosai]